MTRLPEYELHTNCPACQEEVIISVDGDGFSRWIHEVWKFCNCPWDQGGVILDLYIDGYSHILLVKEGENRYA